VRWQRVGDKAWDQPIAASGHVGPVSISSEERRIRADDTDDTYDTDDTDDTYDTYDTAGR